MTLILVPLPCGCVVENEDPPNRYGDVVECQWCGATFDFGDLREWFCGAAESWFWVGEYRPILRFGSSLLEVTGRCECGGAIVRECGERRVPFHFPASAIGDSVVLRN